MADTSKKSGIWIGVDIGTTGVRAVAYYVDGTALHSVSAQYPLYTPHSTWAEQKPEEIYDAVGMVVSKVSGLLRQEGKKAAGIALSTVMPTFVALDADYEPISGLMSWADSRSAGIAREIREDAQRSLEFYKKTCCPVHAAYSLTKLLWLKRERPECFDQMKYVGSIKDYIFRRLTGEWVVDRSTASTSGLYNASTLQWDEDILRYIGVTVAALPQVVPTIYSQQIAKDTAQLLDLPDDTAIVIGATDGVLVNVGIGAVESGQLSATIGTSGAVRMLTEKPSIDPKGQTWCYNLTEDLWVSGGAINNGGITLRWLRDQVFGYDEAMLSQLELDPYELMTLQASKVSAGADGLILLPFFTGERAPHWNSDLRGCFFGLTLNHRRAHFIRASLEGICYNLNSVLTVMRDFGEVRDIRVSGSFTKSPLWLQIMADVFGERITVPSIGESVAFGAAVLGFIADGTIGNIAEASQVIKVSKIYEPCPKNTAVYQELYSIYERLYQKLEPEFKAIVDYQNKI